MLHMIARPNVQVEPGFRPDDGFATHIVDQMLLALSLDADAVIKLMMDALDKYKHRIGNPKGQKVFTAHIMKTLAPMLINYGLLPGKRMRFELGFDMWVPLLNRDNTNSRRLGICQYTLGAKGPGRMFSSVGITCAFTRHALVRLVQRAGCRTPEDLTETVKRAWALIALGVAASKQLGKPMPAHGLPGWLIPLYGMDGVSPVFLVLKAADPETDGENMASVVATVLDQSMIDDTSSAFTKLRDVCALINAGQSQIEELPHEAVFEALEATTSVNAKRRLS